MKCDWPRGVQTVEEKSRIRTFSCVFDQLVWNVKSWAGLCESPDSDMPVLPWLYLLVTSVFKFKLELFFCYKEVQLCIPTEASIIGEMHNEGALGEQQLPAHCAQASSCMSLEETWNIAFDDFSISHWPLQLHRSYFNYSMLGTVCRSHCWVQGHWLIRNRWTGAVYK